MTETEIQTERDNPAGAGLRVAIDVGGTFTDIVIADGRSGVYTYKILNIPDALGQQINTCIRDSLEQSSAGKGTRTRVGALILGTTKCSNTVLEKSGAKTGLICTKGFRDLLEFRDGQRPPIYDIFWDAVTPLISRHRRLEVDERMLASGKVDDQLDEASVRCAIDILKEHGTEAIAIAFLHSYANPAHEAATLEIVQQAMPKAWVCASHEILPEIKEYPRTSTTVINAYLMKTVNEYLDDLESQLKQYERPILIMQSNGGIMTSTHARRHPIRMLESGPAAGVLAASQLALELGLKKAVAFDMGGTTVKACLIENGQAAEAQDSEVGAGVNGSYGKGAGYTLRVPGFDIVEIGAGGGSIAHIDGGALLRVGPTSAGSMPGPVCYGRGGTQPTVTDANVVLGYMNPQAIAGGAVPIDHAGACAAIERDFGKPLGLSVSDAAYGIHRIANSTMARAVRSVTSERGRDPSDYTLVAFGGAGPIHAAALAEDIGIRRAIVPLYPGLFSSVGLQFANQSYDRVKSALITLNTASPAEVVRLCEGVAADLRKTLEGMGITRGVSFEYYVDLRQGRQSFELTLKIPDIADANLCDYLRQQFHAEYENSYGYRREEEPVSLSNVRVKAIISTHGASPRDLLKASFKRTADSDTTRIPLIRQAYFGPEKGDLPTQVITRPDLATGQIKGPAIVEEFDTTIVVPPGWTARLDDLANIVLEME